MNEARTLLLFAKPPRAGRAKTRLAGVLGAEGAASLYACMLADIASWPRPADVEVVLYAEPPFGEEDFRGLVPPAVRFESQEGDDLAGRMERALAAESGRGRIVVLRGTDAPLAGPDREEDAFAALADGADLVFGPDQGGGYYLVGTRRPPVGLFERIATSRSDNFGRTLERARARFGRVEVIGPGEDVDAPSDLEALCRRLEDDAAARRLAPRTARWLESFADGRR